MGEMRVEHDNKQTCVSEGEKSCKNSLNVCLQCNLVTWMQCFAPLRDGMDTGLNPADFLVIYFGVTCSALPENFSSVAALDGTFSCPKCLNLFLKLNISVPESRRCDLKSCAHLSSAVSLETQAEKKCAHLDRTNVIAGLTSPFWRRQTPNGRWR